MANHFTKFSTTFQVGPGNVEAALTLYEEMRTGFEAQDAEIGFEAEANEPDDGTLWLWDLDGGADIENVIAFVLRCAEAFSLAGFWGFCWSHSCDRPRLDSFGGGAQLIDLGKRRSVSWIDADHWLGEEIARLSEPTNPAADAFNPVSAAQGWTATTQAGLLLNFIGQETAAYPAVAARFQAFLATVSAEPDDMLCRECGEPVLVTDTGVSHHVGSGMDGTDYNRDLAETHSVCGCDHVAIPEKET